VLAAVVKLGGGVLAEISVDAVDSSRCEWGSRGSRRTKMKSSALELNVNGMVLKKIPE